jgi:transposase
MVSVGIDLHRHFMVIAVVLQGKILRMEKIFNHERERIETFFRGLGEFQAVVEATGTYRWLYDRLRPWAARVVVAHPLKLKAIASAKTKTDKIDAQMLAKLLEADLIPTAYVPPPEYQALRDIVRYRSRLVRMRTPLKNQLLGMLARRNEASPCKCPLSLRGRKWLREQAWGAWENFARNQMLTLLEMLDRRIAEVDKRLVQVAKKFPQAQALMAIPGIGLYSALLIVAEIGEPERFASDDQAAKYAGLDASVNQSGGHCYGGHISREGSKWLRWIAVECAMHTVRQDPFLHRFYARVRKRRGRSIARVAAARKLVRICWHRLRRWHREPAATEPKPTVVTATNSIAIAGNV